MATSPLQQVPSSSIDLAGLSVTTANPSATDPRPGAIYNPLDLAGVVPVGFAPVDGSNYLMLGSQRWTAATAAPGVPGWWSAWTVDTTPSWFVVDGTAGTRTTLRTGPSIPMATASTSRTLRAVETRSPHFVYTLNDVVNSGVHRAVVQIWYVNTTVGTITALGEETIPSGTNMSVSDGTDKEAGTDNLDGTDVSAFTDNLDGTAGTDTVLFNAGLYLTGNYVYVFGIGSSTGRVYTARKLWGKLGTTTNTSPVIDAPDPYWEYDQGSGVWGTDPTLCAPVQTTTGPMVTAGPISVAQYVMASPARPSPGSTKSTYRVISTVAASGTTRTAQMYASLNGRTWVPSAVTVPLGASGSTYLGGTLQFQQLLGGNSSLVVEPANAAVVPYVVAQKATSGGNSQISLTWGVWQIPRQQ